MTLSADAKRRLVVAVASEPYGNELAAAIDAGGTGPAALVADFGGTANLPGAACAGAASPSAANVNAAIDTVTTANELRLDAIETKINAILAALKGADLMASV